MKKNFVISVLAGTVAWLAAIANPALASFEISADFQISSPSEFYQPLSSDGDWVVVGSYGRCWHPRHVARSWRPYCDGEWVWTDCGWYWQSDEPWAWACYHYGSWVDDGDYGWVWVPGVEWAPAWVVWRTGGDYIGWAPCGPGGVVVSAPDAFVFVNQNHFEGRHRESNLIINNFTVVRQTTVIGTPKAQTRNVGGREQRVLFNAGPDVNRIEKTSGSNIRLTPVNEIQRHVSIPASIKSRNENSSEMKNRIAPETRQASPLTPQNFNPRTEPGNRTPQIVPDMSKQQSPPERNFTPDQRQIVPPELPDLKPPQSPRDLTPPNSRQEIRPVQPRPELTQPQHELMPRKQIMPAEPNRPAVQPQPRQIAPPSENNSRDNREKDNQR